MSLPIRSRKKVKADRATEQGIAGHEAAMRAISGKKKISRFDTPVETRIHGNTVSNKFGLAPQDYNTRTGTVKTLRPHSNQQKNNP